MKREVNADGSVLYTPVLKGYEDLEWIDEAWGHNYSQDCARGPKVQWTRSSRGLMATKKDAAATNTIVVGRQIDFTGTQDNSQGKPRPEVLAQIKAILIDALDALEARGCGMHVTRLTTLGLSVAALARTVKTLRNL